MPLHYCAVQVHETIFITMNPKKFAGRQSPAISQPFRKNHLLFPVLRSQPRFDVFGVDVVSRM